MPNTKTAKARTVTSERDRQRNVAVRSRLKTYIKDAMTALDAKDKDRASKAVPIAIAEIDKAASKGVLHPNSAARKKSTLTRRTTAIS